jgi:ATP-dependent Zn protease
MIDEEVRSLVESAYIRTKNLLTDKKTTGRNFGEATSI